MKIYIVRHGETTSNKEGKLQGWTNDPLNEAGIMLAELTGKGMRGIEFDIAYSSSLVRAHDTAEIVLRESGNECEIIVDDRVKEINMGSFEGKKFRPGEREIDEDLVNAFFTDPAAMGPFPDGESVTQVEERTQDFLKELATKDYENVLVSTHGCALRCMLNFLYDDPENFWHGHVPYNCCVNIVEAVDGKLRLIDDDKIYYDEKYCVDRYEKF